MSGNNISESVKDNIRKHRKERGLSQKKFSELMGVTSSTASTWELGKSEISLKTAEKICEVLNISPLELFGAEMIESDEDIVDYLNIIMAKPELKTLIAASSELSDEDFEKVMQVIAMFRK